MAEYMKCLSLAWTGEFDSLKEFVKDSLKLDGEWSQPGGDTKGCLCVAKDQLKSESRYVR